MKKISKVIFIDDDVLTLHFNQQIVSDSNFAKEVSVYSSPVIALKHFKKDFQDISQKENIIIFVDISMPDMTGHEFAEKFQEKFPEICNQSVIVYLSANKNLDNLIKALDQNIEYFIIKPLTAEKFLNVIYASDIDVVA